MLRSYALEGKRLSMFDARIRYLIDPPLNLIGRGVASVGISANAITLAGLILGLGSAVAVALGAFGAALVLLALGRFADGLDGAVARATTKTDFGGYLDIVCDFIFYGALPLGFVFYDPDTNGLAGAFLLMTFYANGASFLGFAVLAEKRKISTTTQGEKTLYYSNGLLEGAETVLFFVAICVWPAAFALLATLFGLLCLVTAVLRVWAAYKIFHIERT